MFTGFIKCDCNGVCIEVDPFICTTSSTTSTSTSSTTTTTTTEACNRWGYEYLSYTCTSCEIIEYSSLYNSNPLTLDNFYQYGDIVITPYAYLGCDTGISDASIPDEGVTTCEEIDCIPTTTTTTTLSPIICKDYGLQAYSGGGSWTATDCLGESVGGLVPGDGGTYYTGCVNVTTLVLTNAEEKEIIDCEPIPTSTTTTTTEVPITIECITYITGNGNVYAYDPITNLSIDIFNDSNTYFNVLNTDTKLWTQQSGGYLGEYNLTFSPGPVPTYDRLINLGGDIRPIFAIDNFTLIAFNPSTESIDELDITTTTATSTFVGSVESGYTVSDATLTTSGKLILVANSLINISSYSTKIYQYDYATWTLEIAFDVTSQLPSFVIGFTTYKSYILGISQYEGEIYLFSRISNCAYAPNETTSRVYTLDLLTNTLIFTGNESGIACANKASSQLICNTVDIDPNIIPTTTTTSSTTAGPTTTTTTTTLAPTGFNTIYTHFEAL
jgi:hypothetical protein